MLDFEATGCCMKEQERSVGLAAAEKVFERHNVEAEDAYRANDKRLNLDDSEITAEENRLADIWDEAERAAMLAIQHECGWIGGYGHTPGEFYCLAWH